jgi:UPF0716 family protein affecting phage T7 exclusion
MWLFFLFLFVPLIEIALFIQVGGMIGCGRRSASSSQRQ